MKYTFLFFLSFAFLSCGDDQPDDTPITVTACINDIIPDFENQACAGSGDLTKWFFNGEDVYCFNQGTCISDGAAFIYTGDCVEICVLGTIAGLTDCTGLNWSNNAEFIGTIYRY